jgi:hypothetical protein
MSILGGVLGAGIIGLLWIVYKYGDVVNEPANHFRRSKDDQK